MDPNGWADLTADDYDNRPDAKWLQHIGESTCLAYLVNGTEKNAVTVGKSQGGDSSVKVNYPAGGPKESTTSNGVTA